MPQPTVGFVISLNDPNTGPITVLGRPEQGQEPCTFSCEPRAGESDMAALLRASQEQFGLRFTDWLREHEGQITPLGSSSGMRYYGLMTDDNFMPLIQDMLNSDQLALVTVMDGVRSRA